MIMFFKPNIENLAQERNFTKLAACLKHRNRFIVQQAIAAFRSIGDGESFQEFTTAYLNLPETARHNVDLLLASDEETLRWICRQLLCTPTERFEANIAERVTGFKILCNTTGNEFREVFTQSWENQLMCDDEVVACYAAESIRLLGATSSFRALLRLVATGRAWASEEAGRALAAFSEPAGFLDLRQLSENRSLAVQRSVARALQGYRTEEAATILVGWIESPDRALRRIVREALGSIGTPARKAIEQKLGKERSMKVLPELYADEIQQSEESRRQREEFLTKAFCSADKTTQLLKELSPIKPNDQWLEQKIPIRYYTTDDDWVGLECSGVRLLEKSRKEAGEFMNIEKAAERLMYRWENPNFAVLGFGHQARPVTRHAFLVGNRLGIAWKGEVLPMSGPIAHSKWSMTVVKLASGSYFVVEEQTN